MSTDVNSVLELLRRVDVSEVANVSEVHAASIFMVDVCRLESFRALIPTRITSFSGCYSK
jgi:hypothetical protein